MGFVSDGFELQAAAQLLFAASWETGTTGAQSSRRRVCVTFADMNSEHRKKDASLTLSERHDLPHLSVLAEQNGELLDTAVLSSQRQSGTFTVNNLYCSSGKNNFMYLFII